MIISSNSLDIAVSISDGAFVEFEKVRCSCLMYFEVGSGCVVVDADFDVYNAAWDVGDG